MRKMIRLAFIDMESIGNAVFIHMPKNAAKEYSTT